MKCQFLWKEMITLTETILYIFGLIIGLLSGYYFGYAQAGKNYRKELKNW